MRFAMVPCSMLVAALGAAAISQPAAAEIVRLRVDGTITDVNDASQMVPGVQVGDAYSLFYSFESTTPGVREGTTPPSILRYNAILEVSLHIDGAIYTLTNPAMREITLQNDECQPFAGCTDSYSVVASNSIVDPLFFQILVDLYKNTSTAGSALTSLDLPPGAPDLAAFDRVGAQFFFMDPFANQQATLSGSVASIRPVPLPGALWLFATGLAAVGLGRRPLTG